MEALSVADHIVCQCFCPMFLVWISLVSSCVAHPTDLFFPTTGMLRVTFSPAPDCVEVHCWNRAFPTPPCRQDIVIILRLTPHAADTKIIKIIKKCENEYFLKHVILEGFKQNGLQIRI